MFSDLVVVKDGVEVRVPWGAVVDGYGGAPGLLREILSRGRVESFGSAGGLVHQLQLDGASSWGSSSSEDEVRCTGEYGSGYLGSCGSKCLGQGIDCIETEVGDGGTRDGQAGENELVLGLSSAVGLGDGTVSKGVVGKNYLRNKKKRLRDRAKKSVVGEVVGGAGSAAVQPGLSYASVAAGVVSACSEVVGEEVKEDCVVGVAGFKAGGCFSRGDLENVTTAVERRELARGWYERKKTENELAVQRNKYNYKRNEFLNRSRISEKRWEHERLTCEQKLANITEARFGSKPGYAETLASLSDGSELPPSLSTGTDSPASLSDGTISPNSSMSVAEVKRMEQKFESKLQEMSEKMIRLELENKTFRASTFFSGGKAVLEGDKVHVYDGTGQYVPPSFECLTEDCAGSMDDYPEELQHYSGDY